METKELVEDIASVKKQKTGALINSDDEFEEVELKVI
jgi:hypothetical protein